MNNSSFSVLVRKVIYSWAGLPDFGEGNVENLDKKKKYRTFPGLSKRTQPNSP